MQTLRPSQKVRRPLATGHVAAFASGELPWGDAAIDGRVVGLGDGLAASGLAYLASGSTAGGGGKQAAQRVGELRARAVEDVLACACEPPSSRRAVNLVQLPDFVDRENVHEVLPRLARLRRSGRGSLGASHAPWARQCGPDRGGWLSMVCLAERWWVASMLLAACGPIEVDECDEIDSQSKCEDADVELGECAWVDVFKPNVVADTCDRGESHGKCVGWSGTQQGCGETTCSGDSLRGFFREHDDGATEVFATDMCGPQADGWTACLDTPYTPACDCMCATQ